MQLSAEPADISVSADLAVVDRLADSEPQKVVIAGKKQKKVKPEKLHDQENIFADAVIWSYDKEMQILNVLVPDSGEALEMSIIQ